MQFFTEPPDRWVTSKSSALEPELVEPTSADENYFVINGGHCSHIGNIYIIHLEASVLKQIGANYDTGNGKGPRVAQGLPFTWKYTFNFPATLNDNSEIILLAAQGENNLRLNASNPLLPAGRKIVANFSVPENYVS